MKFITGIIYYMQDQIKKLQMQFSALIKGNEQLVTLPIEDYEQDFSKSISIK